MNETLLQALALIVPLVFAIVFHEVAHGYVAKLLGDTTAQDRKRLSLNPLRHVDPFGTLILPGMLALAGAPVFGWAKPVPVNKWKLRNPRQGMMLVGVAGPAANFVMAAVGAVLLGLLVSSVTASSGEAVQIVSDFGKGFVPPITDAVSFVAVGLIFFIIVNIFLALLNLLPIPPLDGSHVVEGLLPRPAAAQYAKLRRTGLLIVILLLIVLPWLMPSLNIVQRFVLPPVQWMVENYMKLAGAVAGA